LPTEQQEIINDEKFTLINLTTLWGRGLAQLSKKKSSMINGSLPPIWPPPMAGFGGGEVPNWKNMKILMRNFTSTNLAAPMGRVWGL
jgi:hypothetical protein